jgi:1,4-dihydroxy-2-naphthoate octaprenyltransferase
MSIGAMVLVALLHSVPPTRLVDRGYGELLVAVQVAYLAPSLGFTLQSSSPNVLLIICSVALSMLLIACLVAIDFSTFAADVKQGRSTILTRLGWEKALILHHVLIVVAYVFIAGATPLGFSLGLVAPAFLAVPFAALQVFLLQRLSAGAKPLWRLLTANATAVFGLTAYFLTLSFWLR